MAPETAAPMPRRIYLDATGWSLLRDAGATRGLPVERLLDTPPEDRLVAAARERLLGVGLLEPGGAPSPRVHAALVVLTTAPVVIGVERVEADRAVQGQWRTAGVPTAGVVVRDHVEGDVGRRQVELQLLTVDDLLDLVQEELVAGDAAATDAAAPVGAPSAREVVEVEPDDLASLPDGLVDGDQLVARAAVTVAGPAGTSVAQLIGDGRSW